MNVIVRSIVATSEISCGYANIDRREHMYRVCIKQMTHSSFVVFYFVFVFWLSSDVSRGTVFCLFQSPLATEVTTENFVYILHLFTEDAENR